MVLARLVQLPRADLHLQHDGRDRLVQRDRRRARASRARATRARRSHSGSPRRHWRSLQSARRPCVHAAALRERAGRRVASTRREWRASRSSTPPCATPRGRLPRRRPRRGRRRQLLEGAAAVGAVACRGRARRLWRSARAAAAAAGRMRRGRRRRAGPLRPQRSSLLAARTASRPPPPGSSALAAAAAARSACEVGPAEKQSRSARARAPPPQCRRRRRDGRGRGRRGRTSARRGRKSAQCSARTHLGISPYFESTSARVHLEIRPPDSKRAGAKEFFCRPSVSEFQSVNPYLIIFFPKG